MKEIVKIDVVKGARVQNLHNGFTFPRQNIMKVYFRDGSYRVLDLFSKLDITDIDYFKDGRLSEERVWQIVDEQLDFLNNNCKVVYDSYIDGEGNSYASIVEVY